MLLMLRRFWGWLWGIHVCEEFTQWEKKQANWTRIPNTTEKIVLGIKTVAFTKRWQERHCTLCGKTQQKSLEF